LKQIGIPEEKIKSIHSPIGLEIKSETPEEIAISIAAEIIKIRNS
jgi:xanthine dehydrogenase accessory factor